MLRFLSEHITNMSDDELLAIHHLVLAELYGRPCMRRSVPLAAAPPPPPPPRSVDTPRRSPVSEASEVAGVPPRAAAGGASSSGVDHPATATQPPLPPSSQLESPLYGATYQQGALVTGVVGYNSVRRYVSSPVCWHTGEALPQCKLVWQRRHGYSPYWKKRIPTRLLEQQWLVDTSLAALHVFFALRGMEGRWQFTQVAVSDDGRALELIYNYTDQAAAAHLAELPAGQVVKVWHGTKFYNLWSISTTGLWSSNDENAGHDFHGRPGVFASPTKSIAIDGPYATPQNLFGTGIYYQCYLQVAADMHECTYRAKQDWEMVFNPGGIHLQQLRIILNAPIDKGASRLQGWEPHLESIPSGQTSPKSVLGTMPCHRVDEWN